MAIHAKAAAVTTRAQGPARGRPGGSSGAELLAVARGVFLSSGYPAATMDAVSAGARISKQTLYTHQSAADDR